jgi:predicted transcriptional regulator
MSPYGLGQEDAMHISDVVRSKGSVEALARTMVERHIRHMPLVVDGDLAGIVSLGEVGKSRIDELETESEWLRVYISS